MLYPAAGESGDERAVPVEELARALDDLGGAQPARMAIHGAVRGQSLSKRTARARAHVCALNSFMMSWNWLYTWGASA
jgi:hypothetical protein